MEDEMPPLLAVRKHRTLHPTRGFVYDDIDEPPQV